MKALLLIPFLAVSLHYAFANTITHDHTTELDQQTKAQQWQLTLQDYQRYERLMQNTPSGHWYTQLDPAEVLALNANNKESMIKYAKLEARLNHQRIQRELDFDTIYRQAYRTLYPKQKPIMPPGSKSPSVSTLTNGDHIWLFVNFHSPMTNLLMPNLLTVLKHHRESKLDIYFVGQHIEPSHIQAWAALHQLPHDLMQHRISLNIDQHRLSTVSNNQSVTLPYVGLVHQGHFQTLAVSSLL